MEFAPQAHRSQTIPPGASGSWAKSPRTSSAARSASAEDDNPGRSLFEHFGTPSPRRGRRGRARQTSPVLEGGQPGEVFAAGAESVMIVVHPTESAPVLPGFLARAGPVAQGVQYSRSAAKKRSHIQSVPRSAAAEEMSIEACSKPSSGRSKRPLALAKRLLVAEHCLGLAQQKPAVANRGSRGAQATHNSAQLSPTANPCLP